MEASQPRKETIETIASAAVRYNGTLFTGQNHAEAAMKIQGTFKGWKGKDTEEGFVTSTGRFVDREEAFKIATKAKQLKKEATPEGGKLKSENL